MQLPPQNLSPKTLRSPRWTLAAFPRPSFAPTVAPSVCISPPPSVTAALTYAHSSSESSETPLLRLRHRRSQRPVLFLARSPAISSSRLTHAPGNAKTPTGRRTSRPAPRNELPSPLPRSSTPLPRFRDPSSTPLSSGKSSTSQTSPRPPSDASSPLRATGR